MIALTINVNGEPRRFEEDLSVAEREKLQRIDRP